MQGKPLADGASFKLRLHGDVYAAGKASGSGKPSPSSSMATYEPTKCILPIDGIDFSQCQYIGIPPDLEFECLRIRSTDSAALYLRNRTTGRFEQWECEWAYPQDRTTIRALFPVAVTIRKRPLPNS